MFISNRSVIIMTKNGNIKRIPMEEFESQSRGGRGKAGAKLGTAADGVAQFITCNNHDSLLFVMDK